MLEDCCPGRQSNGMHSTWTCLTRDRAPTNCQPLPHAAAWAQGRSEGHVPLGDQLAQNPCLPGWGGHLCSWRGGPRG